MAHQLQLRLETMDDVVKETFLTQLPVVFKGSREQCKAYAESRGYVWKESKKELYGGFWFKSAKAGGENAGTCLLPS